MRSSFTTLCAFLLLAVASSAHAQTDSVLSYYNPNSSYLFFPLPGQYGVTSGSDTARTIVAYSERFTAPWPVTYLNSVDVALRIDKLEGGATIPVEARKAIVMGGHYFADFVSSPLDQSAIPPADIVNGKLHLYTVQFNGQQPIDSTFFISVSVSDPTNTQAAIAADDSGSATPPSVNNEAVDRSQMLLDQAYRGQKQPYMAGSEWPALQPGLYNYSNFVIIAHVSNTAGGSAEVYPASVDPLTFFVERSSAGEIALHYTLPEAALASLTLYDTRGVVVETLLNERLGAGAHAVPLHSSLPAGMYYARLTANGISEVRPVVIAR